MDDLVAQRIRYGKGPAINQRAGGSRGQGCNVTNVATYRVEKRGSRLRTRRCGQPRISRWRLGRSHETGEGIDVVVRIFAATDRWIIVARRGVGHVIAERGDFLQVKSVGNAHLVQVSATGKGEQAGILTLPTKTADPKSAVCFSYGHKRHLTLHARRLPVGDGLQSLV